MNLTSRAAVLALALTAFAAVGYSTKHTHTATISADVPGAPIPTPPPIHPPHMQ